MEVLPEVKMDEVVSTRSAEEVAVRTIRAEVDRMLAEEESAKLEVLDETDHSFVEPVSSTFRFSSRLREAFLETIKCKVCGDSFTTMADLMDHLRSNAGRHGLMSDQEIKLLPQRKPKAMSKGEQFTCGGCEKTFPSRRKLSQHKVTHSSVDIRCTVCSQTFLTLSELQKHEQVHSKANAYDCDTCDEVFQTKSALFNHQSQMHPIAPEDPVEVNGNNTNKTCRYCGKAYKSLTQVREHERVHTNEKPFACVKCGKAFNRGCSLRNHLKLHSRNKTYPCVKCGTAFKSYFHLSRHRLIHKDRPFSCDICNKMYATKAKLCKHSSQHKQESLVCDECNKKFKSKLELSRHKRSHKTVEKRHMCDVCNKSYKQASHLQKHKLSHRGTSKKPHVCRFCQKSYSKITQLNLHLQTHAKARSGKTSGESKDFTQENKYNCGICSNSFETYYRMRKHKQMHKDRPYMCDSCEETFLVRAELRRHKQSECSDGYVCEICNKSFSTQHALQSHRIQHALERPYMCSVCHESFKTTKRLKRHMQVHMDEKIDTCPVCDKEVVGKSNIKRHKQICRNSMSSSSLGKTTGAPDSSPSKRNGSKATGGDYRCNICGKAFKGKQLFRQHSKQHRKLPLKQSPRLSNQLRAHEADGSNTEMAEVHTQLANLTSLVQENSQMNLVPEFVLSSGVQVSGNLNLSIDSIQQPSESCVQLIPLNSIAPVDAINNTEPFTPIETAVVQPLESSVSTVDMMCPFCNTVFGNSLECEVHMSSHGAAEPPTSSVCREALDALYSRGNTRGLAGFADHNTQDALNDPQISNTAEKVAAENYGSFSDSDGDFGMTDFPHDEDDASHVEMSCTEILNSLSSSEVAYSSGKDHREAHQLLPRMKKCQLLLHKITLFPCGVCDNSFQSQELLDEHGSSHVDNEKEQPGRESSDKSFQSQDLLDEHGSSQVDNDKEQPGRESSDKSFQSQDLLDELGRSKVDWESSKHQAVPNADSASSRSTTELSKLSCGICSKQFPNNFYLQNHMQRHRKAKPHECDKCGGVFHDVKEHQRSSCKFREGLAGKNRILFKCVVCSKGFITGRVLKAHLRIHSDGDLHECDRCGRVYTQRRHLETHQRDSCRGIEDGSVRTPASKQSCVNDANQDNNEKGKHIKKRAETGAFKCEICPKNFKKELFLQRHMIKHSDKHRYECHNCKRTYKHKYHMKDHQTKNVSCREPVVETDGIPEKENSRDSRQAKNLVATVEVEVHDDATLLTPDPGEANENPICAEMTNDQSESQREPKDGSIPEPDVRFPTLRQEQTEQAARTTVAKNKNTQRLLKCRLCSEEFGDIFSLEMHFMSHSDTHPHKCDKCGRRYKHKHHMKAHQINSCTGVKDDTAFLAIHVRKHVASESRKEKNVVNDSNIGNDWKEKSIERKTTGKNTEVTIEVEVHQRESCQEPEEDPLSPLKQGEANDNHISADTSTDPLESPVEPKDGTIPEPNVMTTTLRQEQKEQPARTTAAKTKKTQRLLKCRICSEEFGDVFSLEIHFMSHSDTHPHKCDKCGRCYKHKHHMKAHQINSCTGVKDDTACLTIHERKHVASESRKEKDVVKKWEEKCEICQKSFQQKLMLQRHMIQHSNRSRYECDKCNRTYKYKRHLQDHQRVSCTGAVVGTESIDKVTQSPHNTNETAVHKIDNNLCQRRALEEKASTNGVNSNVHKCEACSKEFANRRSLVKHAKSHADDRPFLCKACGKSYKHSHLLRHHQTYACRESKLAQKKPPQDEANLPFECLHCLKSFRYAYEVERHEHTHVPGKKYRCRCGKAFKQKYELARHINTQHRDGNRSNMVYIELVECEVCFKKIFKAQLRNHMKCHSEDYRFKCNKCGLRFKYKHNVKQHLAKDCKKVPLVMVCTDKRPYKCNLCEADFTEQSMLSEHLFQVHNVTTPGTEYQLKCQVCPRTFKFEYQLERHKSVHFDQRGDTHPCVCGKMFKLRSILWKHLSKVHVTPRLHTCLICYQMFSNRKFRRCHMRMQHDTRFKCHKCGNTFLKSKHLKHHRRVHKSRRRFKCGSCRREFTKRSKVVSHELSHNVHTEIASCELCGKRFMGKQSLNRHKLMYHPGDYLCRDQVYLQSKPNVKCGLCGKTFWRQSSLVKHAMRTHRKLMPKTCVSCNKTFVTFSEMRAHEFEQHSLFTCKICDTRLENLHMLKYHCLAHTPLKKYTCEVCGKSYTSKKGLLRHQHFHIDKSLFVCEICQQGFKSKADLDAHVSTHNLDKAFVCDVCGTLTSSHVAFISHMRSHSGDKKRECKTCGKGFQNKCSLLAHSKIHKAVTGHYCTVCGKSFSSKNFLTRHARSHREKQWSCEICNKVFIKSEPFIIHMNRHNNVKPYSCKFCDKTFLTKKVRDAHHNTHTKEKPHKCEVCGDCFAGTGTLYRHKKVHEKKNSRWARVKEEPSERRGESSVNEKRQMRKRKAKK
ncbi:uncharacterized protein [Asterias amurensis]|uniref:uncharacterized protein isoform X1 n=1 Tax=Asterias amurensis TaxID=7602 RepID=UPI003AB1704A